MSRITRKGPSWHRDFYTFSLIGTRGDGSKPIRLTMRKARESRRFAAIWRKIIADIDKGVTA